MFCLPRSRKDKSRSTTDHSGSSQISILEPSHESRAPNNGVKSVPLPAPTPATSGVLPTSLAVVLPADGSPAIGAIQDKLEEAWKSVKGKNKTKDANKNRGLEVTSMSSRGLNPF
jgi:hypothetical protein